jgi:aspartyl-tRNA(Asn)/glutamyl-tRNA(Gln) amidotransferase subunit C
VRLTFNLKDIEHHITIPAHDPLRMGTLAQVLNEVATYLELSRDQLVQASFRERTLETNFPRSPCARIFVLHAEVCRWSHCLKISREDVVRVAELAYLDLSESELETYRTQIDEILEYIGKLNELDTANVEPMAQVLTDDQTADATLRDDVVVPCGIAAEVLKQAPDPEAPFFRVPKVIER